MTAQDVIGWDVKNWSNCLSYWEPWLTDMDRSRARVLVVGETGGGLSLWFAWLGFHVICSDYQLPTKGAKSLHAEKGVADRVSYAAADVFGLPFTDGSFDIVACKSMIGGLKLKYHQAATRSLENQKRAVEEMRRVLKPGGVFFGAENLAATRMHDTLRLIRTKGNPGWRYPRIPEMAWLFDGFSRCEQQPYGFLGTHWTQPGLSGICAFFDRVLSRVLPASWLYILFIRARK